MTTLSFTRLAAAAGGLAFALTTGVGMAAAAPDLGPIVNTTCDYGQVISAMNAQDPAAAADFNASPMATSWLQRFLAAPLDKRERMMAQLQAMPESQQYLGSALEVANTCHSY